MSDELRGFLFVADISGYTSYLNESELEHAQGTLTELLELLIDGTRPPLIISRLEGDAVVSYGFEDGFLEGQTFVELVEDTYVAFRRAVDLMVLNNSCRCNACANVSSLDLKFFVHYGSFLLQPLAGYDELIGSDVNLIHRLTKNSVIAETGFTAYCLYTDAARQKLGLEDFADLRAHDEDVADFGRVGVWVQDMSPVYQLRKDEDEIVLAEDEVVFAAETDLTMEPSAVWDYLASLEYRTILTGSDRQGIADLEQGRVGPGTTYQCYHGKQMLPQVVLEWKPFSKMVTEDSMGKPMTGTVYSVTELIGTESGTHLKKTIGRFDGGPMTRLAVKVFTRPAAKRVQASMETFREAVEHDWNQRHGEDQQDPAISMDSIVEAAAVGLEGLGAS